MKESKAMMKKEVSFMKKKGAPKSMLKHEMAEMKAEGRGMAKADMQMKAMKKGGKVKSGLLAGHKAADGMAKKGKTKGMQVKMRGGGMCK